MKFDCDRCGEQVEITDNTETYIRYKNADLCLKCAKIRRFDDDNPIMYPIYKD